MDFVAVRTGFHLHFYLQRSGETIYTFPESLVSSLFWTHDKLEEELFEETIYLIDEAAVYDVNGDGLEDIIILAYGTLGNGVYPNAYVTVFLQEEDSFVATEALGDQMNVLSGVGSLIEVTDVANVQVYYLTMAEVLDYLGEGNLLQDD